MKPPDFYIGSIITDLKWHNRLYKINKLSFKVRFAFLILRVFQQFAYFLGWKKGDKK